jgi:TetR/AcrR family transcriptional repressor of mexJK operon
LVKVGTHSVDSVVEENRRAGRPTMQDSRRLNAKGFEAAFHVFAQEGYAGATIEQIAAEAGTTRRSVSHRFPDKEALLLAVVDVKMREHVVDVVTTEALTSRDPVEALWATCAWILHATDNDLLIAFFRLCIAEAAKFPAVSSTFVRMNDRLEGDVQALVERAQRV